MSTNGQIKQVMGPVVDVEFPTGDVPAVLNALRVTNPAIDDKADNLVLEVAQHLGDRVVRTIAMDSSEGLTRGMAVKDTGTTISTPVGNEVLGRIMNVIGDPIDEAGELKSKELWSIHRAAPKFEEQSTQVEMLMTGIKVVDLISRKWPKADFSNGSPICKVIRNAHLSLAS